MFGLTPYNNRNSIAGKRLRGLFDMENFFESFFNDGFLPAFHQDTMKVDIKEMEGEYVIEAQLPGVKKDQINVELNDNRLTISVNNKEETKEEAANYIRKEIRSGYMSRSFLVENIKNEEVTAKFENGVLSIVLPKDDKDVERNRRIDIA
ncbi:MAG TPA: Hsp20/alpha crystallin family protein [Clostridiales bacterium]|nr:Hsp20/alpha crystallin family protein [Clostridiales bacterium]